jgi:hypothetical protein
MPLNCNIIAEQKGRTLIRNRSRILIGRMLFEGGPAIGRKRVASTWHDRNSFLLLQYTFQTADFCPSLIVGMP